MSRSTLPPSPRRSRAKAGPPRSHPITIRNLQHDRSLNLPYLRKIISALLDQLAICNVRDLGIYLVSSREITRLNESFLQHAGCTDVITFDYTESPYSAPQTRPLHGEIFICVEEAINQSRHFRTQWQSEVVRYIIHGLLHLLGFDDQHPADCRRMKREENRLLKLLTRRFSL